jgi:signal transduction histidine kinase
MVEMSLDESLALIPADADLLGLALGNLVANAIEAMPDGGQLRLVTTGAPGGARIEVVDSGPGMQEEQRLRLFTPYFTTKAGGTGLGLSIAQSVVADHGGRIEVISTPGAGTAFVLTLPDSPVR